MKQSEKGQEREGRMEIGKNATGENNELEERDERRKRKSKRNNIVKGAKWKEAGSKEISERKFEIRCRS